MYAVNPVNFGYTYILQVNPRFAIGGSLHIIYEVCCKHDKPMIIMEPVKGGNLATVDEHQEIKELFAKTDAKATPASWALRYAASLPLQFRPL